MHQWFNYDARELESEYLLTSAVIIWWFFPLILCVKNYINLFSHKEMYVHGQVIILDLSGTHTIGENSLNFLEYFQ